MDSRFVYPYLYQFLLLDLKLSCTGPKVALVNDVFHEMLSGSLENRSYKELIHTRVFFYIIPASLYREVPFWQTIMCVYT